MKTEIFITAPCMFLPWNQLRRIVSKRFYQILKRDIHPTTFFDNEYWSVYFDTLTDDEIDRLLCVVPLAKYKKRWLKEQLKRKQNEFLPETVMAIIKEDIPFNFERYTETTDGLWLFGKDGYIKKRRK